jgi:hypothetical protein
VDPAGQHEDPAAVEPPEHGLARMTLDCGADEAGELTDGYAGGSLEGVGEAPQARAEHDGHVDGPAVAGLQELSRGEARGGERGFGNRRGGVVHVVSLAHVDSVP